MKIAERIVIVLLLLAIIGGAAWLYFAVQYKQTEVIEAVARGEYEIPLEPPERPEAEVAEQNPQADWRTYYPVTVPLSIGSTTVLASVADSLPERIKGLSGTPYLPDGVVKLFVFGAEGLHSIWMKDMLYSLDILWVAKSGEVIHFEENVSPATYPEAFSPPSVAWYVIEAPAGFVASSSIAIGDAVVVYTE